MKHVLLKTIVIVVDKLTRSRVLQGGAGLRGAPLGGDGARKFSLSCEAGWGLGKTKSCGAGAKTPSFRTPPAPHASHCHPYSFTIRKPHKTAPIYIYTHIHTHT